jgi:hypothetical protein
LPRRSAGLKIAGVPGRPASKISFYISEHGYGHATRSIALVRSLAARGNGELRIEVVNHHAAPLLARALAGLGGVSFVDRPTDVGFLCRQDRLEFDRGRTAMRVAAWVGGWKEFVASETARLASDRPDLILSDVAPEPLLVAAKLGVRSTVVSNFSWADQYEPHLRGDLVSPIRGAYTLADRWHAYAMRTPLAGIPRVVAAGLVTREPRASREEARARLGISAAEPLVHVGLGWTPDAVAAVGLLDAGSSLPDAALLLSSNLAGLTGLRGFRKVYAIPDDDTEAHEAIAACDLVVAKAGYGTVAEAIAARADRRDPDHRIARERCDRAGSGAARNRHLGPSGGARGRYGFRPRGRCVRAARVVPRGLSPASGRVRAGRGRSSRARPPRGTGGAGSEPMMREIPGPARPVLPVAVIRGSGGRGETTVNGHPAITAAGDGASTRSLGLGWYCEPQERALFLAAQDGEGTSGNPAEIASALGSRYPCSHDGR